MPFGPQNKSITEVQTTFFQEYFLVPSPPGWVMFYYTYFKMCAVTPQLKYNLKIGSNVGKIIVL